MNTKRINPIPKLFFSFAVLCFLLIPFSVLAKTGSFSAPAQNNLSTLNGLDLYADKVDIFLEKDTTPDSLEDESTSAEEDIPEEETNFEEDDPFGSDEEDISELDDDTFEPMNRAVFGFNDALMDYFFSPLAKGYRAIMPEEGRIAVRNAFHNIAAPGRLVSSLVQLDAGKSGRVLSRFLINTTLGLGGLLDVAGQEFEIDKVDEDFGQALAVHGVPAGPYLVLPVFGPSTTRHAVGRVVDGLLNPINYLGVGFLANAGINAAEQVNTFSFFIDEIESLEEGAIDPYEGMRHFYLKNREKQIAE
ncbi:MAG: MlaA family lipoprotein [Nitrospinales bacterium]